MTKTAIWLALAIGAASGIFVLASQFSGGVEDQYAGKFVAPSARVPMGEIGHQKWHQLLQKYVDTDGRVDYAAWHRNQNDRKQLKSYLEELGKADESRPASKEAKLAYWINAYNAVTIEGILRVYPTTSIRNHTPRVVGYNIWKNLLLYAGDRKISLNDIEHQVLRKMDEPRIHFAIVCASIGCPRLLNEAYTAEKLESQLVTNSEDFFSRSQNLVAHPKTNELHLSSLISWFGSDFGKNQKEQLAYLSPYMPKEARKIVQSGNPKVRFLDYDWNLNKQ